MKAKKDETIKIKVQMSLLEYLNKRLKIPNKKGSDYIMLWHIIYIEVKDGKLIIHRDNMPPKTIDRSMIDMEDVFPEPHFITCHESFIVNSHYIIHHQPGDGGTFTMKGNIKIPISRTYKDSALAVLDGDTICTPTKKDAKEKRDSVIEIANKKTIVKKKK